MNRRRILLLEDDTLFADTLVDYLEESEYKVDVAYDGEEALQKTYTNSYELYLFDINVPKLNGMELLNTLRVSNIQTPTIFLTSYKDNVTLEKCFLSGCDDYIKKPFNTRELLLRIDAVLKRTNRAFTKVKIRNNIYYDFDNRKLYVNSQELALPIKIIQLLEICIENNNKTITTPIFLNHLWSAHENSSEGSLRLYISKLRAIIGKEKILNIKKVGYYISDIIEHE